MKAAGYFSQAPVLDETGIFPGFPDTEMLHRLGWFAALILLGRSVDRRSNCLQAYAFSGSLGAGMNWKRRTGNPWVGGVLAAVTLFGMASQSFAAVLAVFSATSDAIPAGGQGILDLQLSLSPDPGYDHAQFTGGSVTLFSGDGGSNSFGIGSGGAFRDFSFAFTYPNVGNYLPGFSVSASYAQDHNVYVYLYDFPKTVVAGFRSNRCGFSSICSYPIFTTQLVPVYGWRTVGDTENISLSGDSPLVVEPLATPLPGALPLYVTGLGVIALLARRKRQQAVGRTPRQRH